MNNNLYSVILKESDTSKPINFIVYVEHNEDIKDVVFRTRMKVLLKKEVGTNSNCPIVVSINLIEPPFLQEICV